MRDDEIGQRQHTDRHQVIFVVIEFIHRPLRGVQVLQSAQEVTLLPDMASRLLTLLAARVLSAPHPLPRLLQVGVDELLLLLDEGVPLVDIHPLFT